MMDTTSNPLVSGPPNRRKCDKGMTKGCLAGESSRPLTPANVVWIDEKSGESFELTSAGTFGWSKSPRIPAFQCESCGMIELQLQSDSLLDEETDEKG